MNDAATGLCDHGIACDQTRVMLLPTACLELAEERLSMLLPYLESRIADSVFFAQVISGVSLMLRSDRADLGLSRHSSLA